MQNSSTILYDTGRCPLWFRIPALVFGVFTLFLTVQLAAYGLFGINIRFPMSDVGSGSPLLASLACLLIAALWIFVWFAQLRIVFDATRQELVVSSKGYTRWHEHRVSLNGCREFQIRHVRGMRGKTKWKVSVVFADGRNEYLAEIPFTSDMESFADLLKATTKLPVIKYDFVA